MMVSLRGSSPSTMALGVLLLSRARSFGQRIHVEIVGDPDEIGVVTGPATVHSAPVASCGVGRQLGSGALVVVPGPAEDVLAVSLAPDGVGPWFTVDRMGEGVHPATRAWIALRRDRRPEARRHAAQLAAALEAIGCAAEAPVFDLLFGAPVNPLDRISLGLRAGRALSGARGLPIQDFLLRDIEEDITVDAIGAVERFSASFQREANSFIQFTSANAATAPLLESLSELLVHLAHLPRASILPPLSPAADAVAVGLGRALGAVSLDPGDQAQVGLLQTYRFLGGKFTRTALHPIELSSDPPPADRLGRWRWFCTHVSEAAGRVDQVWRDLMDPVS
jgi:hypothetical protein